MALETVTLTRDVIAVLIPQGTHVELPEGGEAVLTQALGGSWTIQMQGHLFRLDGKDADAIGKVRGTTLSLPENPTDFEIEKAVWQQLKTCYDPEIPVDIVNLGLVYECHVERLPGADPEARPVPRTALVRMTLTAPGCGMGDVLVNDVKTKVMEIPGMDEVEVELTFDPPWTREMMSEEAQLQVGFL